MSDMNEENLLHVDIIAETSLQNVRGNADTDTTGRYSKVYQGNSDQFIPKFGDEEAVVARLK